MLVALACADGSDAIVRAVVAADRWHREAYTSLVPRVQYQRNGIHERRWTSLLVLVVVCRIAIDRGRSSTE